MISWLTKHFTRNQIPTFIYFYNLDEIDRSDFIKHVVENKKVINFDSAIKHHSKFVSKPELLHSDIATIEFDKLKASTIDLYDSAGPVIHNEYFSNGLPETEAA
jgi:hypothetical protein